MHQGRLMTLLGGAILVGGALLPWASIANPGLGLSTALHGYDGVYGVFTGVSGLVFVVCAIFWKGKAEKRYSPAVTILAVLAALDLFYTVYGLSSLYPATETSISVTAGAGIYVSFAGAALAAAGGLLKAAPRGGIAGRQ